MAFIEDMFKGNVVTGLAVGIGTAVLAPVLMPAVTNMLRPAAKAVIKGGIVVYDRGRQAVAQLGETANDMVAEARSDSQRTAVDEEAVSPTGANTVEPQAV